MDIILGFINHPNMPWSVAAGIIAFALAVWLAFSLKLNYVRRHLDKIEKELTYATRAGFSQHLADLTKEFNNNPVFATPWHHFRQTLIPPQWQQGEAAMVYTTALAHYFNLNTLLEPRCNLRLYQAMPNILVGIGIWFTFIGLVAALWFASLGVAASDIADAQLALRDLLHAATFKFITSIAGLLASIVFSWQEKRRLYQLNQQIRKICLKLEECLQFSSLEKILSQQAFNNQRNNLRMEQFVQNFPQTLNTALQPLVQNFGDLTHNIGRVNQEALGILLNDFSQRLQGQTTESFNRLQQSLQLMSHSVQNIQQQFDHSGQQFQQSLSQAGDNLQQGLTVVSEQLLYQLNQAAQQIYNSSQHLQAASLPLSQTAHSLQHTSEQIEKLLNGLQRSGEQLAEQNQQASQALLQSSEQVSTVWQHYQQHFAGIDHEMAQVFKTLSQGLEQYRRQVTDFTQQLDQSLNHAVSALNGMVVELAEVLEDMRHNP
jgi:ABC-type transporter Mla subunit MlaD